MTITRRHLLRLAAGAAAAPLLPPAAQARGPLPGGRFFDATELALLDELTEAILPADAHSGGAHAAGVAAYIDGRLAEYDPELPPLRAERAAWKDGLAAVDALCRASSQQGFLEASPEQRRRLLEALAAAEQEPHSDAEKFFVQLKDWTVHGYYTSRLGIHDELEYQGNTMLAEFVGADPAALPPKGGPR